MEEVVKNNYRLILLSLLFCFVDCFGGQEKFIYSDFLQKQENITHQKDRSLVQEMLTAPSGRLIRELIKDPNEEFAARLSFENAIEIIREIAQEHGEIPVSFVDYLIAFLIHEYGVRWSDLKERLGLIVQFWWNELNQFKERLEQENIKVIINDPSVLPFMGYLLLKEDKTQFIQRLFESNSMFFVDMIDVLGKTPLDYATEQQNSELVYHLLKNGSSTRSIAHLYSLWIMAVLIGNTPLVLLLSYGLDIDYQDPKTGMSALIIATIKEDKNVVELLINRGANIDIRDNRDFKAWFYAKLFNYPEIAQLLQDNDPNFGDYYLKWLKFLKDFAELVFDDDDTIDKFVENVQDDFVLIDYLASDALTPEQKKLFIRDAAYNGEVEMLHTAERAGFEVNIRFPDSENQTTLMYAAHSGNPATMNFLLSSRGADYQATDDNGSSLFMHAVLGKNYPIIKFLLSLGVDINQSDNNGFTPLMFASQIGDLFLVNYLVSYRANINVKDNQGFTSLMYAVANGHEKIVKFLVEQKGQFDFDVMSYYELTPEQQKLVIKYNLLP